VVPPGQSPRALIGGRQSRGQPVDIPDSRPPAGSETTHAHSAGVRIGEGGGYILPIMVLDLTDDEARALAKHLRQALDYARHPLAPRLDPLKAILAKLEPPKPQPELPPPLRSSMTPTHGQGRRRR
jgi:hypothetical protein